MIKFESIIPRATFCPLMLAVPVQYCFIKPVFSRIVASFSDSQENLVDLEFPIPVNISSKLSESIVKSKRSWAEIRKVYSYNGDKLFAPQILLVNGVFTTRTLGEEFIRNLRLGLWFLPYGTVRIDPNILILLLNRAITPLLVLILFESLFFFLVFWQEVPSRKEVS